ncbi:MAG: saccharopine dehydrogenase NADP-binding domain-containing protein [Cyanobacteria bacterium P01_F01_bin.42]
MYSKVLIIGGAGRIGQAIAQDIRQQTQVHITVTGRTSTLSPTCSRTTFQSLDLSNREAVSQAIQQHQLVIHCAGPFRDRDHHVLKTCIEHRIPYIDVADSPDYVEEALKLHELAVKNNTIAVLSTGVFPGISCSMVRQGIEQLDEAEEVHLSYLVAGSGGAGVTVMRTTFTELKTPFGCMQGGQRQMIEPYSDREVLEFPVFGRGGVYWFNTVEALTLERSFPSLRTITTKFGSVPDFYNYLTWLVAKAPKPMIQSPRIVEFLSQVSYKMTQVSDRFSGVGISMRVRVIGQVNNQPSEYLSTFYCDDTAASAGQGTGMVAELILDKGLTRAGVWPVEQALSTPLFLEAMNRRNLKIEIPSLAV